MRLIAMLVLSAVFLPLAGATIPSTLFVGVDPLAGTSTWTTPHDPARAYSCTGAATLQVQKNTEGGWDILVRRGAVTPGDPVTTGSDPTSLPNAAMDCPFWSTGTEAHLNVAGSPSTGFFWGYGDGCFGDVRGLYPFTWGGPATFYHDQWYNAYSCGFGPNDFRYVSYVSPRVMT